MDDDKKLDSAVARELTSREVNKIVAGLLGGLSYMAPGKTIFEALDFFYRHHMKEPKSEAANRDGSPELASAHG